MLRIVNIANGRAKCYEMKMTGDYFAPGMIARLSDTNMEVSRGINGPFGIIDDMHTEELSSVGTTNQVTIWECEGIYETDQFDTKQMYFIGDYLYVINGTLTTEKCTCATPVVAIVYNVPTEKHPTLQFRWLRQ